MDAFIASGATALAALIAASVAHRDLNLPLAPLFACLGAALLLTGLAFGAAFTPVAMLVIVSALIVETDRRHHLIPDAAVIALLLIAIALPLDTSLEQRLIGGAFLGVLFLAVREFGGRIRGVEALGLGDVKLAAAIGFLLGPTDGALTVALAGAATLVAVFAARWASHAAITLTGAPFGIGLAAAMAVVALARVATP